MLGGRAKMSKTKGTKRRGSLREPARRATQVKYTLHFTGQGREVGRDQKKHRAEGIEQFISHLHSPSSGHYASLSFVLIGAAQNDNLARSRRRNASQSTDLRGLLCAGSS